MYVWDMTHSYVWHDSFTSWFTLIHETYIGYKRHDSCMCGTWLIHIWHDSFTSWFTLIHETYIGWRRSIGCLISWITFRKLAAKYRALLRKMTHKEKASYESLPSCKRDLTRTFKCETWLMRRPDMTHSCVGHDSFICGTWLIHMHDMTHSSAASR